MPKDPFHRTTGISKGLVYFWVERPQNKRIGVHAARTFLRNRFGVEMAAEAMKRGCFLVDTIEDAKACVAEMKNFRDFIASQYVFGAIAFGTQD